MKERKTICKFFIIVAMGVGVIFYWFTPVQFMQEQSGLLHNHIMGNGAAESLFCRFH